MSERETAENLGFVTDQNFTSYLEDTSDGPNDGVDQLRALQERQRSFADRDVSPPNYPSTSAARALRSSLGYPDIPNTLDDVPAKRPEHWSSDFTSSP